MLLRDLTLEQLGPDAAIADLAQLRALVAALMDRDGLPEAEALDLLWGEGDYIRNARQYGLI